MIKKLKKSKKHMKKLIFEDNLIWKAMQDAASQDILKEIGPISREEYEYYKNLK